MLISKSYSFALLTRTMLVAMALSVLLALPVMATADTVLIETPQGDIEIELLTEDAPNTVANFLRYVDSGKFTNSFVHRSIPGFVIQGGGFTFNGSNSVPGIFPFETVDNEFKVSNTRGTVAMAKIGGQPDSATSQWFINLADNSDPLDIDNGGYTVFARVIGNGMAVADAISQLEVFNAGSFFTDLPVINYEPGKFIEEANLVMTAISRKDVTPAPENFVMNAGLNDAWFNPITNGQGFLITVFPDLNLVSMAWFTYDTDLPAEDDTANLGSPGHRWLSAIGTINGDTAVMNIELTSGGLFDTASEIQRTDPPGSDGTITLSFADCSSGLVEYDITSIDRQGSVPIQRVAGDNIALCEALRGE
jgi:peptidyl-prolyl cis-trans isomerase A (cyclophilin A)